MDDVLLELDTPVLLIEDYPAARSAVMYDLERKNLHKEVYAPESSAQCIEVLNALSFNTVAIDLLLEHWVGRDKSMPLVVDEQDLDDGVAIAAYLKTNREADLRIGMFSSHEGSLETKLRQINMFKDVEILSQQNLPKGNSNKYISDFIERSRIRKIHIKQLHTTDRVLTEEAKLYLVKKILSCRQQGDFLWRIGEFTWKVVVNTIMVMEEDIDSVPGLTSNGPEYRFILEFRELFLYELTEESSGCCVNADQFLESGYKGTCPPVEFSLLFDMFCVLISVRRYMEKRIGLEGLMRLNAGSSATAKFQLAKLLYKTIAQDDAFGFLTRDAVNEYLQPFRGNGFSQILDVYKGRVDVCDEGLCYVKLESYSPEAFVSKEVFGAEFLLKQYIEEGSVFEYTVFLPDGGGYGYYFEVI